jgi:DUF4097 and DUF4098 domain-containing protein YvlB
MKKLPIALLSLALAAGFPARAEDIDTMIDAARGGHVYISNIAGSVEVSGWSKNAIEVTGTLGNNVDELIVRRDGNKVKIKVKVPRSSRGGIASDLKIRVPAGSSLDIGTVSASIDVQGVRGEQDLTSVSGRIDAELAGTELSAESVSGKIVITQAKGARGDAEVDASTVSGNILLKGVSGEVEIESVSGAVRIDGGEFDDAELGSVNGKLVFLGHLRKDGDLSLETVNGSVQVTLEGKISARVEIDTFNGRIKNCFDQTAVRTSKYAPGWELEFEIGDGDGDIEISTLNGRVSICDR